MHFLLNSKIGAKSLIVEIRIVKQAYRPTVIKTGRKQAWNQYRNNTMSRAAWLFYKSGAIGNS